jgi:hypothetical protein
MSILDRMTSLSSAHPKNPTQLFAFQLAHKLRDAEHLTQYLSAAEHYPRHLLIQAYRRVIKKGLPVKYDQFERELRQLQDAEML